MADTATTSGSPADTEVRLSASAARRIAKIVASEPAGTMLRVEVIGGGCSGFSYRFGFANKVNADDMVIERDGATAVIDEASLPFLAGSEIDFVDEIIGAAFKVHNPNATSGCGCGTSFSV
jgi:iron-sulfur cluster assembly accessory protein